MGRLYNENREVITISIPTNLPVNNTVSDILPDDDDSYDLGSPTKRWRDLYLGPKPIHMGGIEIADDDGNLCIDNESGDAHLKVTGNITAESGLIIPSGPRPGPDMEGALFLDTNAGKNGTLKCYSNGSWRRVDKL